MLRRVLPLVLLLMAPTLAPSGVSTTDAGRLELGTVQAEHGPDENVTFRLENTGESVFHGSLRIDVHEELEAGACEEEPGHRSRCPRVARLWPGFVTLEPGQRLAEPITWQKVDDTGRGQGAGTYVARLVVYDVSSLAVASTATFSLTGDQGHGPENGYIGPRPGGTYARSFIFHWWAVHPDGLRGINTSLLDDEGVGAIFLDHREAEDLPEGPSFARGGGAWSVQTFDRPGENTFIFTAYPREGDANRVARFPIHLATRNVSFEPTQATFERGENVTLDLANTGTVPLEGPARWNVSGHGNPDADGWVHREPEYRFAPLEPGDTRQLVWDQRTDDGEPAPPGEYTAYVGVRGHLSRTTFEIEDGPAPLPDPDPPPSNRSADANASANATTPAGNGTANATSNVSARIDGATVETSTNQDAQDARTQHLEAGEETRVDVAGSNGSIRVDGEASIQQGEQNVLLEDANGTRLLVIAPSPNGSIQARDGRLDVSGAERVLVHRVDETDALETTLVPAWLDGRVGAVVDAREGHASVATHSDMTVEPRFARDDGRTRLEVNLSSPAHEGRLVAVTVPTLDAWQDNLTVRLDDAELPRAPSARQLANATPGQEAAWAIVEQDGKRSLVVAVDHFSTRTLSIAPATPLTWLPAAIGGAFVLALGAIFLLGRD